MFIAATEKQTKTTGKRGRNKTEVNTNEEAQAEEHQRNGLTPSLRRPQDFKEETAYEWTLGKETHAYKAGELSGKQHLFLQRIWIWFQHPYDGV